jgi:pimeloyl-ACP methyl ester carboxylesterase
MSKNGVKTVKLPCVGYDIAADWYEGKSDQVLLTVPGWSSSKQNYEDLVGAITNQTEMAALVIDLAGHGDSPFRLPDLMPAQNLLDLINAYDWLSREHPDKNINVMGTSYGGYLAAWLAEYRPVNKLVLRAPAIYRPEDMYRHWGDIDREETRLEYRQNASEVAKNPLFNSSNDFEGQALVVVHELDEEIPVATSDAYIKAFHADKYVAEGLSHKMAQWLNERSKVIEYQQAIATWLNNKT